MHVLWWGTFVCWRITPGLTLIRTFEKFAKHLDSRSAEEIRGPSFEKACVFENERLHRPIYVSWHASHRSRGCDSPRRKSGVVQPTAANDKQLNSASRRAQRDVRLNNRLKMIMRGKVAQVAPPARFAQPSLDLSSNRGGKWQLLRFGRVRVCVSGLCSSEKADRRGMNSDGELGFIRRE
jgi:hypothetical protein